MIRYLAGAAFVALLAASPAAANNWNGYYFGADIGWAEMKDSSNVPASTPYCWWGCESYSKTDSSFIAGLHAGVNWQSSGVIYGIEGDLADANVSGTINDFCSGGYCDRTEKSNLKAMGSLRARLGFDMGDWMPYITGGLAVGNVRNYVADNNDEGLWDTTQFRTGWDLGGGAEWMMDPQFLLRLQGMYYDLGSTTVISKSILDVDGDRLPVRFADKGYTVTFGISWLFN